jgi:hypothetical protein
MPLKHRDRVFESHWGMDAYVRLLCVSIVLRVSSGLASGRSPVQEIVPTLYRFKKLKNRPSPNKKTVEQLIIIIIIINYHHTKSIRFHIHF